MKIIKMENKLTREDIDRIIGMAWEDRTPFDAIESQFNLNESEVIKLMRKELKHPSFIRWRKRVTGRKTKHSKLIEHKDFKFKSKSQKVISQNKKPKSK